MIVAVTSALISLAIADRLAVPLAEFDVATTDTVVEELERTAAVDDVHGRAAQAALETIDAVAVHECRPLAARSSRVDEGAASCLALAREREATFLLTDDLRALPELQALTDARVALSPIVLRSLVERGVLAPDEATDRLDALAATRGWLGAPIYRRARRPFDDRE